MKGKVQGIALLAARVALVGSAITMALWSEMPWPGVLALAFVGASTLIIAPTRLDHRNQFWKWCFVWTCTLLVPLSALLTGSDRFTWRSFLDYYWAIVAWLIAVAILAAACRGTSEKFPARWRALILVWFFCGDLAWLSASFLEPHRLRFCAGLAIAAALLMLLKAWFRLAPLAVQAINTLILFVLGLPLVDLALHPAHRASLEPKTFKQFYNYRAAKKDRAAFESWWNYYDLEIQRLLAEAWIRDPADPVPVRLRPNSHISFVDCHISINSKGFRGKVIPEVKGDAYRIVALGESTTFGYTINAGQKPWPEMLEELIRERLKPGRPVQVINAGMPSATLADNLKRLPTEILPLKPDMILCYHGINGFYLLDKALPALTGPRPPAYKHRPLQLIGDCEYRLKLMRYSYTQRLQLRVQPPSFSNLMDTDYARAYRQLIEIARTNQIRLALGNFPLAVNGNSQPELVEFFRSRHPLVDYYIKANLAHDSLVRQLCDQNPGVCFVNTHPGLDGVEENYLDVMHVTEAGDRLVAGAFLAGIRQFLQSDLAPH